MNCPSDGTTLLMSERQGIEIDYCPECRGVWLDRGELDKILERAQAESEAQAPAAPIPPAPQPQPQPQQYAATGYDRSRSDDRGYSDDRYRDRYSDDRRYSDQRYGDTRYRKKKSPFEFLGDIFD
ncbi:MAG: zf-TFIIB domain-containing protein [Leucobacter sp.]